MNNVLEKYTIDEKSKILEHLYEAQVLADNISNLAENKFRITMKLNQMGVQISIRGTYGNDFSLNHIVEYNVLASSFLNVLIYAIEKCIYEMRNSKDVKL